MTTPTHSTQSSSSRSSYSSYRLLIANRGEIACRIMHTARKLGWECIAVYSQADRNAPHVHLADQAILLGGADLKESYLNLDRLMEVAHQVQATAIHPGYGFFSENEHFAQRCLDEGFLFVGPSPQAIQIMGDKRQARLAVAQRDVPCVPGYDGENQENEYLYQKGTEIGFPLMVKASMGGGGKGMRLVQNADALMDALGTAKREATAAFGSGSLILEKAIIHPRHIEIQVFADQQGHTVHLGERECSLQRRNQKVIEEAPSVSISEEIRQQMGQTAVRVAQAVEYVGAGTVEFLYEPQSQSYYFLEMNTRIQVEHPVTEEVYGVDLVEWQLEVALGNSLPLTQDEINQRRSGHSIEARIYAEDPAQNYQPQAGKILAWLPPNGDGIRVESGVSDEVSPYYDPMIAKLIATGPSRAIATRRLQRALAQLTLLGPHNNIAYLQELLATQAFHTAQMHTRTLDEDLQPSLRQRTQLEEEALAALLWVFNESTQHSSSVAPYDGWSSMGCRSWDLHLKWDATGQTPYQDPTQSTEVKSPNPESSEDTETQKWWTIEQHAQDRFVVSLSDLNDELFGVAQDALKEKKKWVFNHLCYQHDLHRLTWTDESSMQHHVSFALCSQNDVPTLHLQRANGDQLVFNDLTYQMIQVEGDEGSDGVVRAPMSGKILEIRCAVDQDVEKGQALLVIEAMKLEHLIEAPCTGKIKSLLVQSGDQASSKQVLVEIEAAQ